MFIPGKTDVVLKIKYSPEWEEWSVRYYEDGVYNEDKSYYTDDHDDAIGTQRLMADEAYQMGARTVEAFA